MLSPELIHITNVFRKPLTELPRYLIVEKDFSCYVDDTVPNEVAQAFHRISKWDMFFYEGWWWGKSSIDFYHRVKYCDTELVLPKMDAFFDGLEALIGFSVPVPNGLPDSVHVDDRFALFLNDDGKSPMRVVSVGIAVTVSTVRIKGEVSLVYAPSVFVGGFSYNEHREGDTISHAQFPKKLT